MKSTIEIMATLPSVVLGFLAGLWLPPRVRGRPPDGAEIGWVGALLTVALAVCLQLNGSVEAWLFGGDFPAWLRETTSLPYEQRNTIVVGIAMGFGRARGETMMVLMATGNTPIMDWNLLNGFRTLSANIAVEIPEAPVGSALYRTLFVNPQQERTEVYITGRFG